MARVEIEGIGIFKIKRNLLRRGINPRIITNEKGKYEVLQFNAYQTDILPQYYQMGYDRDLNNIYIRLID